MEPVAESRTSPTLPTLPPGPAGGWRELLAVLAAAALLAVVLTFPFAAEMTHVGRVDNFDAHFGIWNVSWVARTLVVDPLHVLDANIFFPLKKTLVYSETNLGAGALAIPAYWATRNPYFTFNFAFLLSMIASAAGGYYLVRYLTRDRRAASVAGIAFGFCPYVFARTPQMQLLWTAGLPFSMLAFHRAADRPSITRAMQLGLVMAAQVLFCGYYAVFSLLMVGFATFVAKDLAIVFVVIWIRWTLPRFRVDQMMSLCWKYFIPFAFVSFVGETVWTWLVPAAATRIAGGALFVVFGLGFGGWFVSRVRDNARRYQDLVLNDALGPGPR